MNEVMCLAEDNGIIIYYQDTDSIHIKKSDVPLLAKLYKEKYGRNLIGKNMGQFHGDFEFKGCENIYSKRFIGLGKKCYLDVLVGTDIKTKEEKIDYHIRMKSIPNQCIHYTAEKYFDGSVVKLYEALFNGEEIAFDLLEGGRKCKFETFKDLSIESRDEFIRRIKFKKKC